MKLRAELFVDIMADDYVDAANHQKAIEDCLAPLRAKYPEATFSMRERRDRKSDLEREPAKTPYLLSIPKKGVAG